MKPSSEQLLEEALRDQTPEVRVNRMWSGIERRRATRGSGARRTALPALAVAAVAMLTYFAWPQDAGVLALEDGDAIPSQMTSAAVTFSDGSRIETGASARVDTLSNLEGEVAFALRSGDAHFDIVPNGPRRWRVVAGAVEVVVVGTVFDVQRSACAVEVRVARGVVLVRGDDVPDGEQRLEAGDVLTITLQEESERSPSVEAPTETETETVEVAEDTAPAEGPSLTLDELLRRADSARRLGEHSQAVGWLARASREFPEEPRAALAAFTQGRIELDELQRPPQAARSFARSLRLGLPAPLRETASALRVESLGQAGNVRAQGEAALFLERYPQSEYRTQVLEWTESAP